MEGAEDAVLLDFPFGNFTFQAITVERPSTALRQALSRHGYIYAFDHGWGGDQLWLSGSFPGGAAAAIGRIRADATRRWVAWFCASHDPTSTTVSTHRRTYRALCDDQQRYLRATRGLLAPSTSASAPTKAPTSPSAPPPPPPVEGVAESSQTFSSSRTSPAACLISAASTDGIGHQVHARLLSACFQLRPIALGCF